VKSLTQNWKGFHDIHCQHGLSLRNSHYIPLCTSSLDKASGESFYINSVDEMNHSFRSDLSSSSPFENKNGNKKEIIKKNNFIKKRENEKDDDVIVVKLDSSSESSIFPFHIFNLFPSVKLNNSAEVFFC
jgi:hypothetical protein